MIRARFSDAMFFWKEDRKVKLESRLEALKNVVYQARLGTSYEKVMRFRELAVGLAERFDPAVRELTERAALMTSLGAALPSSVRVVHEQVTDPASLDADLVVGADGVRSVVRGLVDPAAAARRPTPYVATRGILRGQPTTTGEGEYWGRGLVFGRQRLNADDTYWFSAFRDDGAVEPLDPGTGLVQIGFLLRDHKHGTEPIDRNDIDDAGW